MESKNHLSWYCDEHTASELYSQRFKGRIGSLIIKRQNDLLFSSLGNIEGKSILDVGAGHGQLADEFLNRGARVTAYGSGEKALVKLIHLPYKIGPLYPLPFRDREFDVVVSFRTFSHVPDWRLFFKELCRVARERVSFDFVTLDIFKPLLYPLKLKREPGTRDYTVQKKKDIIELARQCGFYLKYGEGEFLLPLVIHRILKMPLLMPAEYIARFARLTRLYGGPVVGVLERI